MFDGCGTSRHVEWTRLDASITNLSFARAFVNMSATFFAPSTFISFRFLFSIHSFRNLYFMSMCLVLLFITDVSARLMHAELSS